MDAAEITSKIKRIIGDVAGIDPRRIADDATLRGELDLDSLSLLQISGDVDLEFQLDLPDELYRSIDSLPAMVDLVRHHMAARQPADGQAPAAVAG